jgi:Mrp family chromosome partitioning ATPase
VGILAQEQRTLLTNCDVNSAYSIAYQTVYANIRFDWDTEQSQQYAILLAPPAYSPGQTSAVVNIAIAAAQSGTPTILVDADLRRPGLHEYFGASSTPGLSDWLASGQSMHEEIVTSFLNKTFIPDMHLLSAGTIPLQSQEINRLLSTKLAALVTALRQHLAEVDSRPSMIIFHGPPVLMGIDASLIGALVERTFLMIVAGHTTRTQARLAQEQLRRAHAMLAGSILLNK